MRTAIHIDCAIQGPYATAARPAPVYRADAPLEVDPSAEDTQRCVGEAMRMFVDELAKGKPMTKVLRTAS